MNGIVGDIMSPSVGLKSCEPIVVVRGVNCTTAFMVGGTRLGSDADTADTLVVPVVQEVLLGRRAPGRVEGDVIILGLGSLFQRIGSGGLELVYTGGIAMDPSAIKSSEGVAHTVELSGDLVRDTGSH